MEERRLGVWDHADWKAALDWPSPISQVDRLRRATKLGEPLGPDAFLAELEVKAGRRLRVGTQGRPPAQKLLVVATAQQALFAK